MYIYVYSFIYVYLFIYVYISHWFERSCAMFKVEDNGRSFRNCHSGQAVGTHLGSFWAVQSHSIRCGGWFAFFSCQSRETRRPSMLPQSLSFREANELAVRYTKRAFTQGRNSEMFNPVYPSGRTDRQAKFVCFSSGVEGKPCILYQRTLFLW